MSFTVDSCQESNPLKIGRTPEKLCNAPILALPEGSEDFIAYCDASKKGLGAIDITQAIQTLLLDASKQEGERLTIKIRALVMTIGLDHPNKSWNAQKLKARKPRYIKNEDVGG
ncbi:hypothetical protein Tco_1192880 [Tanacetum coccineum]